MNIKSKNQLVQLIKSTPITDILVTNGKANQKHLINNFTKDQSQYILIKTASNQGVIK